METLPSSRSEGSGYVLFTVVYMTTLYLISSGDFLDISVREMVLHYFAFLFFILDECHDISLSREWRGDEHQRTYVYGEGNMGEEVQQHKGVQDPAMIGHTQFIYTAKDEVQLRCDTNKWIINTMSENKISCLVNCEALILKKNNNTSDVCQAKESDPHLKCSLKIKSGFFACVKVQDPGFFFPFKPSPSTTESYIVALPTPNVTSMSEITTLVKVNEGESVLLNCSFNFTKSYSGRPFVVYWIKTTGQYSTCVYSYDYDMTGITRDHHCDVPRDLPHRLTNRTNELYTHDITISGMTKSDTGQYLCVICVDNSWQVIHNITLNLHEAKTPELDTDKMETGSDNGTAGLTSSYDALIPLYVTLPALLCLLVASVVVFIKRTTITSPESKAVQLHSQIKEEEYDVDCSPYAVGRGDEDVDFGSKWNSPPKSDISYEESTMSLDPYSVVTIQGAR